MAIVFNNPKIEFIENSNDDGEHEGFSIKVNDKPFGVAVYGQNLHNQEFGYDVITGVGNFEVPNSEVLIDELVDRILNIQDILSVNTLI